MKPWRNQAPLLPSTITGMRILVPAMMHRLSAVDSEAHSSPGVQGRGHVSMQLLGD